MRFQARFAAIALVSTFAAMTATPVGATCGYDMPALPLPGNSREVTILVPDPNLGEVERSFRLHIPAGYSPSNDVEVNLF